MTYLKRDPAIPSPDTVIWRYMDDWKFEDLLKTFADQKQWNPPKPGTRSVYYNDPGQLWFGFPGSFGDEKEGHYPDVNKDPATYCDRMAQHMGLSDVEANERKLRFLSTDTSTLHDCIFYIAQLCGVSCWHANDSESSQMWKDFVAEKNGVAIRSTCQRVEHALAYAHNSPARRASPALCAVGYVDYADYWLPADGYSGLLSLVQESYSHESEVRFFAKSVALAAIPSTVTTPMPFDPSAWPRIRDELKKKLPEFVAEYTEKVRSAYIQMRTSGSDGFRLPVSLPDLFSDVVLKPGCSPEYEATVTEQLRQAGLEKSVVLHKSSF